MNLNRARSRRGLEASGTALPGGDRLSYGPEARKSSPAVPYLDFLEDEDVFWRLAKVEPDAVVLTTLAAKNGEGCAVWPVLFNLAVGLAGPMRSLVNGR